MCPDKRLLERTSELSSEFTYGMMGGVARARVLR
jgi:hypothetical protein